MALTLDELKAQNALETEEPETIPQVVEETEEIEAVTEEPEETPEVVEPDGEEPEEPIIGSWMDTGEEADERLFTNSDIGAAKRKLKAKLEVVSDENDLLKAEISKLQQGAIPDAVGQKPKRDQFYDAEDPEEAFIDAITDWKINKSQNANSQQQQQIAQAQLREQQQRQVNTEVGNHYARASKLIEKSKIPEDTYRAADQRVRSVFEGMVPGGGDIIVDKLISDLGEGSEAVFFNLGINNSRLEEAQKKFQEDPSGMKLAMYLGSLRETVKAPRNKTSNAPAPAPQLNGDASTAMSDPSAALKKKYQAAHKKNDMQSAFDARSEARKAGTDVSNW
jgi:hypothetical protein